MVQGKGAALLAEFATEVETAESVKASQAGSQHKKVAKLADSLVTLLREMDVEADLAATLDSLSDGMGKVETDLFDRATGDKLAADVVKLAEVDAEYQPAGFDADKASDLISRWKTATGRRGSGGASVPESQKPPVPIRVTFTFPDDHTEQITHSSTWSSVSNELTQRAKKLDEYEGKGYQRPESASQEWKAAVKSIRDGGEGGTVTIPTKAGNLVAEVVAVR